MSDIQVYDFSKDRRSILPRDWLEPESEQWYYQAALAVQTSFHRLPYGAEPIVEELKRSLPNHPWAGFPTGDPAKTPDSYFKLLIGISWKELKRRVLAANPDMQEVIDELDFYCTKKGSRVSRQEKVRQLSESGKNQQQIADILGVTQQTVSNDLQKISVYTQKICKENRSTVQYNITQYTKPEVAAKKIAETFGDEYALALAQSIMQATHLPQSKTS